MIETESKVSMSPYWKCKCEQTRRYRGNSGRSAGLFPCIRCVHCDSGLGQIPNPIDGVQQEPLDYPEPKPHPLVVEILVDQHGKRQEYRECADCDFREPLTEAVWQELFHRRKTKRIRDMEITAIHFVVLAIIFVVGFVAGCVWMNRALSKPAVESPPEPASYVEKIVDYDQFTALVTFRHPDGSTHRMTVRKSPEWIARQESGAC